MLRMNFNNVSDETPTYNWLTVSMQTSYAWSCIHSRNETYGESPWEAETLNPCHPTMSRRFELFLPISENGSQMVNYLDAESICHFISVMMLFSKYIFSFGWIWNQTESLKRSYCAFWGFSFPLLDMQSEKLKSPRQRELPSPTVNTSAAMPKTPGLELSLYL